MKTIKTITKPKSKSVSKPTPHAPMSSWKTIDTEAENASAPVYRVQKVGEKEKAERAERAAAEKL